MQCLESLESLNSQDPLDEFINLYFHDFRSQILCIKKSFIDLKGELEQASSGHVALSEGSIAWVEPIMSFFGESLNVQAFPSTKTIFRVISEVQASESSSTRDQILQAAITAFIEILDGQAFVSRAKANEILLQGCSIFPTDSQVLRGFEVKSNAFEQQGALLRFFMTGPARQ